VDGEKTPTQESYNFGKSHISDLTSLTSHLDLNNSSHSLDMPNLTISLPDTVSMASLTVASDFINLAYFHFIISGAAL
jgi:hypothetical protein